MRELEHGGMGTVYLAHQDDPPRDVALKLLHPLALTAKAIRRFEHEAAVLARLLHPGIAQIYATGTAEMFGAHVPWFAMELVDGQNLIEYEGALASYAKGVEHSEKLRVLRPDDVDAARVFARVPRLGRRPHGAPELRGRATRVARRIRVEPTARRGALRARRPRGTKIE